MANSHDPYTHDEAFLAFDRMRDGDPQAESRTELANRLGVTRQRIHTLHVEWTKEEVNGVVDGSAVDGSRPHVTSRSRRPPRPLRPGGDRADGSTTPTLPDPPPPTGREAQMTAIVTSIRLGSDRQAAYQVANVLRSTAEEWIREDRDFKRRVLRAEGLVRQELAKNIMRIGLSNRPDAAPTALKVLATKDPEDWSERQRLDIHAQVVGIDVMEILSSPERILEATHNESLLQQDYERRLELEAHDGSLRHEDEEESPEVPE